MDAIKFLEERARMCGHGCAGCRVFGDECDMYSPDCDYESLVKAVEAWATEHPRKTRQSVFLEQWTEAQLDEDGVLKVCPALISAAYSNEDGGCVDLCRVCVDCRREFWMEEVE